jgi:predicted flap endonuclease-1-like 5' DNA nuclease
MRTLMFTAIILEALDTRRLVDPEVSVELCKTDLWREMSADEVLSVDGWTAFRRRITNLTGHAVPETGPEGPAPKVEAATGRSTAPSKAPTTPTAPPETPAPPVDDDLTALPDVGPAAEASLRRLGLGSYALLAEAEPTQVAKVRGISLDGAEKIIKKAKTLR